jgi:hypothetical protein
MVEGLRAAGIGFAVARARNALLKNLNEIGLTQRVGQENFYPTVMLAVTGCEEQQDHQESRPTDPGDKPGK